MIEGRPRTLYGRRRGKKLRAGQEALLDTLLPRLLIEVPPEPRKLDPAKLFECAREVWLEVGFGAGEYEFTRWLDAPGAKAYA